VFLWIAGILFAATIPVYFINKHRQVLRQNAELKRKLDEIKNQQHPLLPNLDPKQFTDEAFAKPSPSAFEVLKMLHNAGHHATITVELIKNIGDLKYYEARDIVKELWDRHLIYTVIPGQGEWNGHYGINDNGRDCVRKYAT
jgi:hypothetical protein